MSELIKTLWHVNYENSMKVEEGIYETIFRFPDANFFDREPVLDPKNMRVILLAV